MPLPHVYADFNAIEYLDIKHTKAEMALTSYGTLASLARQRLSLKDDMALLLYEPNDIECVVTVHFDLARKDPAGRHGEWVARFDPREIRNSTQPEEASKEHPCVECGHNFLAQPSKLLRNYRENCTQCGASIMEPMVPPERAT